MLKRSSDPLARRAILAVAAGRLAIGSGALLATRPALRGLGFAETDASGLALARLAGGRDLALAAVTLAVREDRASLRAVALAGAALDAADALTFALAAADFGTREAGVRGVLSGAGAAALGIWAWRRL